MKTIAAIWSVDPCVDFIVCENCMAGHCGAVPGFNANNWLEDHEAAHAARKIRQSEGSKSR